MKLKTIGIIEGPHGHKGTVKVKKFDNNFSSTSELKQVFFLDNANNVKPMEVFAIRKYRRGKFLMNFLDIKLRNQAENLNKCIIAVRCRSNTDKRLGKMETVGGIS